jgi:Predicted membrane protein
MFGALLAGLFYRYSNNISLVFVGEVLGTSFFGGLAAYLVAGWMGITDIALTAYIVPFFLSTIVGSILAVTLYRALDKRGIIQDLQ